MILNQGAYAGLNDVITSAPIGEDTEPIMELRRTIHTDRDTDAILGKKLNNRWRQQCGVCSQAEIDRPPLAAGAFVGVGHYLFQQWKIHEGLATKERNMHGLPPRRLVEKKVDRRFGSIEIHEFRL